MIDPVSGTSSTDTSAPAPSTKSPTDALTSTDTFLQLLVAQIKNQNPLEPTDGVQFLSQLAQFTQVEQSTQIRDQVTQIHDLLQQQVTTQSQQTGGTSDPGITTSQSGN